MPQPELITDVAQITPAWLSAALAGAGTIDAEHAAAVRVVQRQDTGFHVIVRLQLDYSQATTAPVRLVLKFSQPDRHVGVPERGWEVIFYNLLAAHMPDGPVLRCYDAVFSPQHARVHLLLEDVSASHYAQPPSHLPPVLADCRRIVDALARLHAHWWERPPFEVARIQLPGQADIEERVRENARRCSAFQSMLGDRLSDRRRQIYADVLRAMPRLFQRLTSNRGMSVVHGDVHIGNFLYPHDPDSDSVRIIDWQTWNIDLAVKDLAHMMAYFWFPERRTRYELALLQYYHERLQAYGVTNYDWRSLYDDYRLCVIRLLFHPAWQWENGENTSKVWFHLERIMLAYDDLGCAELVRHTT